ncbi:MAG: Rne/Rng family ribonuclease [Pyrinomonadaceae bacterium]
MSKEMIISVNGREKKIAVLDNGKVTEFYIERGEENSGVVGNIYKGRVMRVLPGMQSAFVDIGLERDAFLYVSDFFDEEEEIERIVMEKSKKVTPEEAKREANEQIDRARLEREKQMEAVQEIAEPLIESGAEDFAELEAGVEEELFGDEATEPAFEKIEDEPFEETAAESTETVEEMPKGKRGKSRRGKKGKQEQPAQTEAFAEKVSDETPASVPDSEAADSGFERIVDDEDTGEMFKDAYRQEAIFDKVRAIEFDMESAATAEVGSLINTVSDEPNGFERIADEDEQQPQAEARKSKRGNRGGKGKKKSAPAEDVSEWIAPTETVETQPETSNKSKKTRSTKSKKSADAGETQDSINAVSESSESAENKAEADDRSAKGKSGKGKSRGGRKSGGKNLKDAEASLKDSGDTAEMAARRGGRGRRAGRGRASDADAKPDEKPSIETERPAERPAEQRPVPKFQGSGNESEGRSGGRYNNRRDERRERPPQPTITDLLREGQEILVQIAKEPIARKGARITSHIALPGRFLVYMPTIEHLGVSRKIESASERGRLRVLIQKIRAEEEVPSGGFIVRTAGVGISEEDLRQDARYLVRTWLDVKKNSEKKKSPALAHQDLDIIQRLLRDHLSDEYTAIRVDSEEEYLRIVEFINRIQPRMVRRVKLYTRDEPILEAYNVQEEIDKALKPRVWLKSGGYLVINQTEALVAIDVNTGKFVGKGNARLEDTITKTNMEAVEEIARQIRLRDLGGILVLDLIDMEDRRNRHKVMGLLQDALASDKSPTKVLSYNDFGLIIMTRKRVKQSLERTLCTPCEYCDGAGWVKSPQTVCYEILEESRRLSRNLDDVKQTTLRIHPEVSLALRNSERAVLEEIEAYLGNVDLTSDPTIHQNQFDFAFV